MPQILTQPVECPFSRNMSPPQKVTNSRDTEEFQLTQNTIKVRKRKGRRATNKIMRDRI